MTDIFFLQPEYLYLLLLLPLLYFINFHNSNDSLSNYKKFAEKRFLKFLSQNKGAKGTSNKLRLLLIIFTTLLIFSLAQLQGNKKEIKVEHSQPKVILAFDLSLSMDGEDIYPSRLKFIKTEIANLLKQNLYSSEISLITYANIAYFIYPFSHDYQALINIITDFSTDLLNNQGSNVTPALTQANKIFNNAKITSKNVILITDGDFEIPNYNDISTLAAQDINLYIIAVATDTGAPIMNKDGSYITQRGKRVISKLNRDKLSDLKNSFNAKLFIIENNSYDLRVIFDEIFADINLINSESTITVWQPYFYIFTILSLFLLASIMRYFFILIIAIFIGYHPSSSQANIFLNSDQNATRKFNEQDYSKAEKLFRNPYNQGVAAYKNSDYQAAIRYFKQAEQNHKTIFNLGNSYLLNGDIKQAINSYEQILAVDAENEKARKNLDIAKKLLKEEQQKQENKKDKSEKQQQDKQDSKTENNTNQDSQESQNSNPNDNTKANQENKSDQANLTSKQGKQQDITGQNEENRLENTLEEGFDEILDLIDASNKKSLQNKIRQQDKNSKQYNNKPW